MFKTKVLIFILILAFQHVSKPAIILFDVGDTLITTDKVKAFWNMGLILTIKSIFNYLANSPKKDLSGFGNHVQNFYLDTLDKIPSPYEDIEYQINGLNGRKLPPLLRDATLGRLDCDIILQIGNDWIEKNEHLFKNETEINLFKKIFHFNFTPKAYINGQKLTKYAYLLPKCHNSKDKDGKRKNKCIILSNFTKDWLPNFKDKFYESILKYVDFSIFSCNIRCAKPSFQIFDECFDACNDKLKELWILIDDQQENRDSFEDYLKSKNLNGMAVHPKDAEELLITNNLI